ncbi:hypothetical protein [Trinickia acidisoli]|uniref:hypothetical protein n=1 Tax=Trinickia acidisoli TaxID=2767482 RepID=UPI001F5E2068|nr:hypothetical protein [Trinickia acidisoli]
MAAPPAWAGAPRANRGNDPFFQVSQAVSACPVPLGPMETEQEWLGESHYRIERGNSCWWEGRCRLSNSYLYDKEIEEAVKRRLTNVEPSMHWRERTTLWLMLQRRFVYVQGCVAPGFDKQAFLSELAKTADVERIIDETTTNPASNTLPYRTQADPDKPADFNEGG